LSTFWLIFFLNLSANYVPYSFSISSLNEILITGSFIIFFASSMLNSSQPLLSKFWSIILIPFYLFYLAYSNSSTLWELFIFYNIYLMIYLFLIVCSFGSSSCFIIVLILVFKYSKSRVAEVITNEMESKNFFFKTWSNFEIVSMFTRSLKDPQIKSIFLEKRFSWEMTTKNLTVSVLSKQLLRK